MAKCNLCGKRIETTFLGKMLGTQIKAGQGKKAHICSKCQALFPEKEDLLKKIK